MIKIKQYDNVVQMCLKNIWLTSDECCKSLGY